MQLNNKKGFTLVELVISVAIFALVSFFVYEGYYRVMRLVRHTKAKSEATLLASEQFEIVRNLNFTDVGLIGGIPAGKLQRFQTLSRSGFTFFATTTVRSIDDPFDGTISSTTNKDLAPADYKMVSIDVACISCDDKVGLKFDSIVVPKGLETSSNNGALIIKVFDANGVAVQGANIHISNNSVNPAVSIDEISNNNGELQVVDAPTSTTAYNISVTKSGYSSDQTYASGWHGASIPVTPYQTVLQGQITQASFSIDKLSTVNVSSRAFESCVPIPSSSFTLSGSKIIGTNPDVYKNVINGVTDSLGVSVLNSVEWDTFNLKNNNSSYYLAGTVPTFPLSINPDSKTDVMLILAPKNLSSLLVTVKDSASGLPISNANVFLTPHGGSDSLIKISGQGYKRQTDWSGGSGQNDYVDETRYESSDGNIDVFTTSGQITLKKVFGNYVSSGNLTSSSFDLGTSSNVYTINWLSESQPALAGSSPVKFQLAMNNDDLTWNFVGPDGTDQTYYDLSNQAVTATSTLNRYVKYKVFLSTDDNSVTPTISDISFTYSTACTPPGQVYFDGLNGGTYDVDVSKTGYNSYTGSVQISPNASNELEIDL